VFVPPFPSYAGGKLWRAELSQHVFAASGNPDQAAVGTLELPLKPSTDVIHAS